MYPGAAWVYTEGGDWQAGPTEKPSVRTESFVEPACFPLSQDVPARATHAGNPILGLRTPALDFPMHCCGALVVWTLSSRPLATAPTITMATRLPRLGCPLFLPDKSQAEPGTSEIGPDPSTFSGGSIGGEDTVVG